jgi:2-amino-4-hydroxy-6-hydroxymethyldihydropteridine diphosphokinase
MADESDEISLMTTHTRAYLSLGTNLGDRLTNLADAVRALEGAHNTAVVDVSPVYQTAPLGPEGVVVATEPAYLNCAVLIETELSARALRAETQRIEHAMGRGEHGRWESRVIDIDLVLFGDERIATSELTVPHARMCERAFVLRPLVDLDPGLSIDGVGPLASLLPGLVWQACDPYATAETLRAVGRSAGLIAHGVTIVGRGRLGSALAEELRTAGVTVTGPLGRGAIGDTAAIVLLCVPDREIARAAAAIAPGRLVGHCSGAATLEPLAPHEAFSMHPLMTVVRASVPQFRGAGCAVAGTTPLARAVADALVRMLGMQPVEIADGDRALYHAAATMASNYIVTLECVAERLAARVGVSREMLAPLARASLENWIAHGRDALTGPIARGDVETVERQRAAIDAREPELLALWDALVRQTTELAAGPRTA